MRVSCLTFHNSSNYGSILQSYALQQIVRSLGYEYDLIDYSNPEKYKYDSLLGKNDYLSWKGYAIKLASLPYNYIKRRKFAIFSQKYLNVASPRFVRLSELNNICDKYDFYICGSDQVWNTTMVRYDPAYFLSFVKDNNKKIAYAASIGRVDLTDTDRIFYQDQLKNFDKISVRESSAQQILLECADKNAKVVLDPTLLFKPQQWYTLADCRTTPIKPYILTYCLSYNSEIRSFIEKLRSRTGLKVIGISCSFIGMVREKVYTIPSPLEFVNLFSNASYIVTNSFHGTAFSANLSRNFYTFIENKVQSTNSRIIDFLGMLGLQDRLMITCPQDGFDLTPPDFRKANLILDEKRKLSIEFLKQSLRN